MRRCTVNVTFTDALAKELMERTSLTLMECRKALVKADGNMYEAEELLRARAASRPDLGLTAPQLDLLLQYIDTAVDTPVVVTHNSFVAKAKALDKLKKQLFATI